MAAEAEAIAERKLHYCEECGKSFSSGKAYGGHKSNAHVQANKDGSSKKPNSKQAEGFGSGDYPCPECGKMFWSKRSLFGHMRCHPEREWRGMEPPPPSKLETNSDADLVCNLMDWSTRSKRGRRPISHSSSVAAGRQLLVMLESPKLQPEKKIKSSESDSGDSGEESPKLQPEKKIKSSELDSKATIESHDFYLDTGRIDLGDERVRGALDVLANGMEKKMSLKGEKGNYKCNICGKDFLTHQALGGHMSSHNKFKFTVVGEDLKSTNVKTHRRIKTVVAAEKVAWFDLNKMPGEEGEDGDANFMRERSS